MTTRQLQKFTLMELMFIEKEKRVLTTASQNLGIQEG
jgi:hypothetical protein